jgi:PBP1b-binding outer membrane lipoprotein LpoB
MRIFSILVAWIVAVMFFVGCAPSRVEMDHGMSYNLAKYNQIQNPDAEKNLKPVEGLDGKAANATVEKYRKDFEKPTPAPAATFSVGSGTSMGSGY